MRKIPTLFKRDPDDMSRLLPDLPAWLLEQIAERERTIRAAGEGKVAWAIYRRPDGEMDYTSPVAANGDVWVTAGEVTEPYSVRVVFDPAVELTECDAKRKVINLSAWHLEAWRHQLSNPEHVQFIDVEARGRHSELTLKLLAVPYSDRPGYRAEWKL